MTHVTRDQAHSAAAMSGASARTSELRAMIALALPVVLVQVGTMAMGVVDTVMVGHVSASVLASVALGNLYYFNATVLGMGTLMALDPIVAQAVGAGDETAVRRALQRGLLLALLLSVFTAIVLMQVERVLVVTHQQPSIVPDTVAYVRISIP